MPELLAGPLEKTSLTYTVPACTLIAMPSDPRSLVRYTVNIREYGSLRGNNYTLARDVKRTPALGGGGAAGCVSTELSMFCHVLYLIKYSFID